MKKILTIVGARPQFIKAATVTRIITEEVGVEEILVHTGQHYDKNMSDVFFNELKIPLSKYHLGIGSGSHGLQTGKMLEEIEKVILTEQPDLIMVYGDTNSTLAGALAAVKLHLPIAHVEAGLRSFNKKMPEEINRILTDHSSDLLFTPSITASDNLFREGIPQSKVHLVGDVMFDAALYYGALAESRSLIITNLGLKSKEYILATIHRAENTENVERLQVIINSFSALANEIPIVLPIHPRTRNIIKEKGIKFSESKYLNVIDPVGYIDMVMLEKNSAVIATDSGGVQKEAFFFEVPCVTLRDETEWVELVQLGWNKLIPPHSSDKIQNGIKSVIGKKGVSEHPYGDGTASSKIIDVLKGSLK